MIELALRRRAGRPGGGMTAAFVRRLASMFAGAMACCALGALAASLLVPAVALVIVLVGLKLVLAAVMSIAALVRPRRALRAKAGGSEAGGRAEPPFSTAS